MKQHSFSPFLNNNVDLDPSEIDRFNALSEQWWDADGPMAPLHRLNPVRMDYITETLTTQHGSIKNKTILDVGCGGGLVSEALARLGAKVTGIDGAEDLIAVAQNHAAQSNLPITYRHTLTGDLKNENATFDIVTALEVIEHVPDQAAFVADIADLTRSGGTAIFSTLNRTAASFAFGIVAAEYVMRWLPRGTHDWKKFVKPSELYDLCRQAGLEPVETMGIVYRVSDQDFHLDRDNLRVNYFLVAKKP